MVATLLLGLMLTLGLCALSAWQSSFAPIDCSDGYGHGPDPGTRECDNAIEWAMEHRPQIILGAFLAPLPWCLAGMACVLLVQGLTTLLRSRGINF